MVIEFQQEDDSERPHLSQLPDGSDRAKNGIVFEVRDGGDGVRKYVAFGDGTDANCLRKVWAAESAEHFIKPELMLRVYSEWEPSPNDRVFLADEFPHAQISFTFDGPDPTTKPGQAAQVAEVIKAKITSLVSDPPPAKRGWRRATRART